MVVIRGDGQQCCQVWISVLGVLTVCKTVKKIKKNTQEEWKQCSVDLSGKKTSWNRWCASRWLLPSFCAAAKSPVLPHLDGLTSRSKKAGPGGAESRDKGKPVRTDRTKFVYWQSKYGESPPQGFCCRSVPLQLLKMTPQRARKELLFPCAQSVVRFCTQWLKGEIWWHIQVTQRRCARLLQLLMGGFETANFSPRGNFETHSE